VELENIKNWWREVTKGPLGWVIYIALGVALAIALNSGLSLILSTDYPVVTVESDSMEPVLYPGDIVFVRSVEEYEPGDIIVFDGWKQTPIIHRVVSRSRRTDGTFEIDVWQDFDEITEEEMRDRHLELKDEDFIYVTKGDNNPTCDQCQATREMVLNRHVHGKQVFRVPYLGWIKLASMRFVGVVTA